MKVWLPTIRTGSGADVFTERLAAALRTAGADVVLTWYPHQYEIFPELLRWQKMPADADVIQANSWNANVFLGLGIPVVTSVLHLVHDPAYAPYRSTSQALYHRWQRFRETRALRDSDAITAISTYVAGTVREFCGREDVVAIPNWVDMERYAPDPGYAPVPDSPFRLLMVANHTRRKGFDLLPALAAALGPKFELRCTGGLRNATLANISGVHPLGRLSEIDLIEEYKNCDAVVSLSRYEGFGYTALEAMACGKPFLGFRCGAISEVVEEGTTALLCDIDDVAGLAMHARKLAEAPGRGRALGSAGRQRALSMFTEAKAANAYLAVYKKVATRKHARSDGE